MYACPIGSTCPNTMCNRSFRSNWKGWVSIGTLHKHINRHCKNGEFLKIPKTYWKNYKKFYCKTCKIIANNSKKKSHTDHYILPNPNFLKNENCSEIYEEENVLKINNENKKNNMENQTDVKILDAEDWVPSWEEIWKYNSKTMNMIPPLLHKNWEKCLENLLNQLTTFSPISTLNIWKKWAIISKVLWWVPYRSGKRSKKANLATLKNRIDDWKNGEIKKLWDCFKNNCEKIKSGRDLAKRKKLNVAVIPLNKKNKKNKIGDNGTEDNKKSKV